MQGEVHAVLLAAVYRIGRKRNAHTALYAATALKRVVKDNTKTRTEKKTSDLWGVIISAPIQQFRWKFWKPVSWNAQTSLTQHFGRIR